MKPEIVEKINRLRDLERKRFLEKIDRDNAAYHYKICPDCGGPLEHKYHKGFLWKIAHTECICTEHGIVANIEHYGGE